MQKHMVDGRLTSDVVLETRGANNTPMVYFTLAVRDGKNRTDFIRFVAFNKTAELLTTYSGSKGDLLALDYSVRSSKFEREGKTVYQEQNIVNAVEFLNTKRTDQEEDMTYPPIDELPEVPTEMPSNQNFDDSVYGFK